MVSLLEEEAARLRRLVDDLLDFGRVQVPQPVTVEAGQLVAEAVDAAAHQAAWQAARPKLTVQPGPAGLTLHTDPAQLRRALLNLLANAAEHVAQGGEIRVTVRATAAELAFEVWNAGAPMAADVVARVFEPFFTTREEGTGLGLAIARRISTDLGGHIALEQRDGGVAFVITLPRQKGG